MSISSLKIYNANIITPNRVINNGTLIVENGRIKLISEVSIDYKTEQEIDAKGNFLSPGFIDIHVHGGAGHDFMDNTIEAYLEIAKLHARYGTTSFTPTTLSCENEDLLKTLELYEQAEKENTAGAEFIGIRMRKSTKIL